MEETIHPPCKGMMRAVCGLDVDCVCGHIGRMIRDDLMDMPPEDLAPYIASEREPMPHAVPELLECVDDEAVTIRRAAAKTLQFLAAQRPDMVQPWAAPLLDRVERLTEPQPLWQLIAACWPLEWSSEPGPASVERAMAVLQQCFDEGRSIVVSTNAMHAMVLLATQHPRYREDVRKVVDFCETCSIPALAARSRILRKRHKTWLRRT